MNDLEVGMIFGSFLGGLLCGGLLFLAGAFDRPGENVLDRLLAECEARPGVVECKVDGDRIVPVTEIGEPVVLEK